MSDKKNKTNQQQTKPLSFANMASALAVLIAVIALVVAISGGGDKEGYHGQRGPMIGQMKPGPMMKHFEDNHQRRREGHQGRFEKNKSQGQERMFEGRQGAPQGPEGGP